MINNIVALGYGLVVFAIIIGVGSVVLFNFGGAVGICASPPASTYNRIDGLCHNDTTSATPTGPAYTNTAYVLTQLGSTGLAGWVPAIIAVSVGVLFLGMFMVGQQGNRR